MERRACEAGETSYSRGIRSNHVTLLRGRKQGLEVVLAGREVGAALDELDARLAERPGFYRGTVAVASFGTTRPSPAELNRLHELLDRAGIEMRAVSGSARGRGGRARVRLGVRSGARRISTSWRAAVRCAPARRQTFRCGPVAGRGFCRRARRYRRAAPARRGQRAAARPGRRSPRRTAARGRGAALTWSRRCRARSITPARCAGGQAPPSRRTHRRRRRRESGRRTGR